MLSQNGKYCEELLERTFYVNVSDCGKGVDKF